MQAEQVKQWLQRAHLSQFAPLSEKRFQVVFFSTNLLTVALRAVFLACSRIKFVTVVDTKLTASPAARHIVIFCHEN